MNNFRLGDYVYGNDWCYGEIIDMDEVGAWVEFDTGTGGGTVFFEWDEIVSAKDI